MPQRTILIIEDDASIRQGIVDAVEFEGYPALVADGGEAASNSHSNRNAISFCQAVTASRYCDKFGVIAPPCRSLF